MNAASPRNWLVAAGIFVLGLIVLAQTTFVVPEQRQALVLQFGNPTAVYNPAGQKGGAGLAIKAPFMENVVYYDKRNLLYDSPQNEIVTKDQERLVVDAFMTWRIANPLKFYQSLHVVAQAENRLDSLLDAALRDVLGKANSSEIISGRRAELMRRIAVNLNGKTLADFGVAVIDVRIKKADLPGANLQKVYDRMSSERALVAAGIRARGEEQKAGIEAEARKQETIILAEARRQAEQLKGEGDAMRSKIYAAAFGKDPEFYSFYRSLIAYENALKPENTRIVISPRGDFFSYFAAERPGGR